MSAPLAWTVISVVAFQLAWAGSAISAAAGRPWIGVLLAAAVLAMHALCLNRRWHLALTILATVLLGLIVETGLLQTAVIVVASPGPLPAVAPLWLLGLWAAFATLLGGVFQPLGRHPVLAILTGGIFGPLAYLAGHQLGALRIVDPIWLHLAMASAVWAVVLPLLLAIERRLPD